MAKSNSEPSRVSNLLTRLMGVPYEVSKPPVGFHGQPKWFVWNPGAEYGKTGHVWAVWLGYDGTLRLESADFDNTTDWIERSYGEEGAIESTKLDYRYSAEEVVRNKLAKKFPLLGQLLVRCDSIITKVSSGKRVGLGLIFEGTERMAWFKIGAVVAWRDDWKVNEESIGRAVAALKEAYDSAVNLEGARNV